MWLANRDEARFMTIDSDDEEQEDQIVVKVIGN